MDDLTPGQRRTQRARETRTRNRLDRLAAELRGQGFGVITPETMRTGFSLAGQARDAAMAELEATIIGVRGG